MTDTRPCTCALDERPYPCQHQYALGLCRKAEIRSLRTELDRCIAQIGDLAKLRSEEEITHGHVMGRIAIALFGDRNNRTDEECVKQAIDVICERNRLRQHLHDEHQRHIGTMNERDVLRQDCFNLTEKVIPNLREQRDALRALLQKLRGAVRLYRGGGVAGQQMGNESYSILVTGHTLGDIDAALAGDKP